MELSNYLELNESSNEVNHIFNPDHMTYGFQPDWSKKIDKSPSKSSISIDSNDVLPSTSGHVCTQCGKTFSERKNLNQHMKIHDAVRDFICDVCGKAFITKSDKNRHMMTHEKTKRLYTCEKCSLQFNNKFDLMKHMKEHKKSKSYTCEQCSTEFKLKIDLMKHMKRHKLITYHSCNDCDDVFTRKLDLQKHLKVHKTPKYECQQCDLNFNAKATLNKHIRLIHPIKKKSKLYVRASEGIQYTRKDALNTFTTITLEPLEENMWDFIPYFEEMRPKMKAILIDQLYEKEAFKWYSVVKVTMSRINSEGDSEYASPFFRSSCITQLKEDPLDQNIEGAIAKMLDSFEKYLRNGSGWTLEKIHSLELNIAKYNSF